MKVRLLLLTGLTAIMFSGLTGRQSLKARAQKGFKKTPILLTEICFYPMAGEPGWVEISNWGEKPIDVSSYSLSVGEGNLFVFPNNLEAIPAEGIILVIFDGKRGRVADDLSFGEDKLAIFHTDPNLKTEPNGSGVFPKETGTCSLYAAHQRSSETIIDFVCWGGSDPNLILKKRVLVTSEAVEGRVWGLGGYVITSLPSETRVYGAPPPLKRGGSISRKVSGLRWGKRAWYLCDPEDVSAGTKNTLPRPVLRDPKGTVFSKSSKVDFSWWGDEGESYELEIGSSKDFLKPVVKVNVTLKYHVLDSLPPGKYYWRVRRIKSQMISEWSETAEFTVNPTG